MFPKFVANLAVLFKYGGVIKSYIRVTKDTLINQQSDKITDKSKDEIEAGLCSSTYEAVPASGSKFRSRQFQSCHGERVRVFVPLSL